MVQHDDVSLPLSANMAASRPLLMHDSSTQIESTRLTLQVIADISVGGAQAIGGNRDNALANSLDEIINSE